MCSLWLRNVFTCSARIKAGPHHLRYTAHVVAVGLVDLRLQNRPHVPRLDTDPRQADRRLAH